MNRLALVLLSLLLSQCAWLRRPTSTTTTDPAKLEDRWERRERDRTAFEDGLTDGAADLQSGVAKSYHRHHSQFTEASEAAYSQGYNEGYDKAAAKGGKPGVTSAQQQAYDIGYSAGVRDRRLTRGADPDQHEGSFDPKLRSWFLDGYHEGFEGR